MNNKEEIIKTILIKNFNRVYCDTCEFNDMSEEEAIKKYDSWACEWCHRKSMCYKLSEASAIKLAHTIIDTLNNA